VTFQAEGEVWIKGSNVITGWKELKGLWIISPWRERYPYDGTVMDGSGNLPYNSAARREQVFVNRAPLQWVPDRQSLIRGSFFWAADGAEIFVFPPEGVDLTSANIEVPTRSAVVAASPDTDLPRNLREAEDNSESPTELGLPSISDIVIRGFYFAHNVALINRAGVRVQGERWLLENNTVEWMNTVGAAVDNLLTMRGNLTRFNGQTGIGGSATGAVIEKNTSYYDNSREFSSSWGGAGLKFTRTIDLFVRNQVVVGAGGPGIWFDIDCISTGIEDCVVLSNRRGACGGSHGGIFYEISCNAAIRRNVIFRNHIAGNPDDVFGAGITVSSSTGVDAGDNTVIFCDSGLGLPTGPRDAGSGPPGAFWRRFGTDVWLGRNVDFQSNLGVGDTSTFFGISGQKALRRKAKTNFRQNVAADSLSGGRVLLAGTGLFSLAETELNNPASVAENTMSTLPLLDLTERQKLNNAATQILAGISPLVSNFSFSGPATVEAVWQHPQSAAQILVASSAGSLIGIADLPTPTRLNIVSNKALRPKAWFAGSMTRVPFRTTADGLWILEIPQGFCLIAGLDTSSRLHDSQTLPHGLLDVPSQP